VTHLDYPAIRQQISMRQVLDLLAYEPTYRRGHQWRGRCLLTPHAEHPAHARCFCIHLDRKLFYCCACRRGGNHLDLWAAIHHLTLRAATLDLCQRFGIEPIPLRNMQPPKPA
jgi:DNA primase